MVCLTMMKIISLSLSNVCKMFHPRIEKLCTWVKFIQQSFIKIKVCSYKSVLCLYNLPIIFQNPEISLIPYSNSFFINSFG